MILRKIDIEGFKSFAKKTEFLIKDGITGVVGPNGSGKSNIADAIRWVLGEQSSKNLRGSKMEDVIFNGTQSRAKKAFCEVTLHFEECEKLQDYTEVAVSRRMYRSGESEYILNGTSVRLRDVLELFRDTGIGKEGYSIIGQGRVDEILSSKPTARRRVFEEAAGIAKYRSRKEEAERKLDKTQENLIRVEDIAAEIGTRLPSMSEQATRTKTYVTSYERLKILEANVFLANSETDRAKLEKANGELNGINAELACAGSEFEDAENKISQAREEWEKLNELSGNLQEQIGEQSAELERFKGDRRVVEAEVQTLKNDIEGLETEEQKGDEYKLAITREIEELKSENEQKSEYVRELDAKISNISREIEQSLEATDTNKLRLTEISAKKIEISDEITEKKTEISRVSQERQNADVRRDDLESRIAMATAEADIHVESLTAEQKLAQELDEEKQDVHAQLNENTSNLLKGKDEIGKLREIGENIKRTMDKAGAQRKMLIALSNEYEGYSDSVKNLMRHKNEGIELMGTLAELINVSEKFETAVETALGGALQNVVVPDEGHAKRAISLLREKRLGRVTFLPVGALRVNYLSNKELECEDMDGFMAVASEAVDCTDDVAPAVDFLLARTIIVRDMDSAVKIMKKCNYGFRAVTLEGDIVRPGGVMTGGSSNKRDYGLLSRSRNIENLGEQIGNARVKLEQNEREIENLTEELDICKGRNEALMHELKDIEIRQAEVRERVLSCQRLVNYAKEQEQALSGELDEFLEGASKLSDVIEKLEDELYAMEEILQGLNQEGLDLDEQIHATSSNMTRVSGDLAEFRIARAERSKECESLVSNIERLERDEKRILSAARDRDSRLKSLLTQVQLCDENIKNISADIVQKEEEIEKVSAIRAEIETQRPLKKQEFEELESKFADYLSNKEKLTEKKFKLEAQVERLSLSLENSQNRLWDEYEMTLAICRELVCNEFNVVEGSREADGLKRVIRELGPVNPSAVEEYEELKMRHDELCTQRDDLLKAREDLNSVIDQLMEKMKISFKDKFDSINSHFARIYTELFGGGRAYLNFEEGDIMECGIDIHAEPPGKKLQNISLLSGGERALTAIALLFAMLTINPSPLCLLDEIDAPLDEANVVRLGNYISSLTCSQFLVITHRKPTMAICDTLYGVAMEERGISSLVSVRMNESS